jgi:hypothetical protein
MYLLHDAGGALKKTKVLQTSLVKPLLAPCGKER